MDILIALLKFFGITPDKYPFLVLAILIVVGFVFITIYLKVSIGGNINKITTKLSCIKDNVNVIVTYLSITATNRGKLDTNLIRQMSPMRIMPNGYKILEESGFKGVFDISENKNEFFKYLDAQKPKTRLDVENYAMISLATFVERNFMNPIKSYLYDHPDIREPFQILAGLYVRDEYLREHPEITQ